jgi:hypothetical protein
MRVTKRCVAVLAVLACAAALAADEPAAARRYFFDSRGATNGADGSRLRPWTSLDPIATLALRGGDSLLFACGSRYEGGFVVNGSGASNAPIVITSYGAGPAPKFTNPSAAHLNGNAIRVNGSHVIVDGLFFERCPANPVSLEVKKLGAVFLTTNATHCVVQNCEMTQTPIGVMVYGAHNLVTHNHVHDNNAPIKPHWGPLGVMVCTSHHEISHNRFENLCAPSREYGHDGGAIEIHDRFVPKEDIRIHHNLSLRNQGFIEFVGGVTQDNFLIHHNVCMDYQSFLGLTGPCTNFRVEHNTVVRVLAHEPADSEDVIFWNYFTNTNINFQNNIFVYDPARVEPVFARGGFGHSYNLFYRTDHRRIPPQANASAYQRKYLGGGAHLSWGEQVGDPRFKDLAGGDFHLRAGSPAIGKGTNLGYAFDFEGNEYPKNRPPTVGAYEFVPLK